MKENVNKSKLGGEFAKKGWNAFPNEFSGKSVQTGEAIKKQLKIDPKIFKEHILAGKCEIKKRTSMIEHEDFFTSKAKDMSNFIKKQSLQGKNQKDRQICNLIKYPNSVFFEVQNIQDSFQLNKFINQPNICLKSPELNKNIIVDFATKKASGQENVVKKRGVSICQFSFQENSFSDSMTVKRVKKANFMYNISSLVTTNSAVANNLSKPNTDSKLMPSYSYKNHYRIGSSDGLKYQVNTGSKLLPDQNENKITFFNHPDFLEDESSNNKGSNWIQSLKPFVNEIVQEDTVEKKRIRNILPGGFAEQLLKLQRIEKSEKVFRDHFVDRNKREEKRLSLVLISTSHAADIVMAECLSLHPLRQTGRTNPCEKDSFVKELDEVFTEPKSSEKVIVLLEKCFINKLHLKAQSIFYLYPPWQIFHLPFISCPVLLCAEFMEGEVPQDNILDRAPIFSSSAFTSIRVPSSFNEDFHQSKQFISLSGRIQRVVKIEMDRKDPFTSIPNYFRYSLLIQDQKGVFHELIVSSAHLLPDFWHEFISETEGKCYEFHNLLVINRLCLKRCRHIFRVLMPPPDRNSFQQKFCYQLTFCGYSIIPEVLEDKGFPPYVPVSVQPLASLFKEPKIQQSTFFAKIIFQFNKTLFVCDDSVPNCIQLESLLPINSKYPLVGSLVLIRDTELLEGCLFLDSFSSFIQISEESQSDERFMWLLRSRWDQLKNLTLQNFVPLIDVASENDKFVFIKGEIINVDENNALSWLQCNVCYSDNLVQDSRLAIYCENCLQVVPRPVLHVKMSVTCQYTPHVKAEIELLSRTIKGILEINDDTYQPQCKVDDILGKQLGPLLCYIRNCTNIGNVKQFHAVEVDTS